MGELILQRFRGSGDDGSDAAHHRRHDVGKGFAGSGAGLDNQVPATSDCVGDQFGHFALSGAVLGAVDRCGDRVESCKDSIAVGHRTRAIAASRSAGE